MIGIEIFTIFGTYILHFLNRSLVSCGSFDASPSLEISLPYRVDAMTRRLELQFDKKGTSADETYTKMSHF